MNFPSQSAVFAWAPACLLRVSGPDAAQFLQGQLTNDLRSLPEAPSVYGLWLSVKGKVVADSFVLAGATPDEFWVVSYFCPSETIRARLESHIIADDVTLDDQTLDWRGLTTFDEQLGQRVKAACAGQPILSFAGRRTRASHREWLYPVNLGPVIDTISATSVALNAADVERLRIDAGIPSVPADIGPGDLPNEGGLEADAISFTKGCYLGQEVMARLKSMGQVRRRLIRVSGEACSMPVLPAPVFVASRPVGELRSAIRTERGLMGLAMLTLLHVTPATKLALAPDGPAVLELAQP